MARLELHEDRLFPADPATRAIARRLYAGVRGLSIISPHGHTDPAWFADNAPPPALHRSTTTPEPAGSSGRARSDRQYQR